MSLTSMTTSMLPDGVLAKLTSWMQIIKSLPFDGGPSVTRWVFLRTAEVISLGWLALVGAVVWRYAKFGTTDGALLTAIVTLGGGLFAFAQQTQSKKLDLGAASTPQTGGSVD